MKMNENDRNNVAREDMVVEMLMEQGRLLHSGAVFDICARTLDTLSQLVRNSSRGAEQKKTGWALPR